jgi:HTH-type transcriptional regulator/antitoxin HigA
METRNENMTPWIATHPGTILKYELDDRGLSQKVFAEMMGMQKSHICELIKASCTVDHHTGINTKQITY